MRIHCREQIKDFLLLKKSFGQLQDLCLLVSKQLVPPTFSSGRAPAPFNSSPRNKCTGLIALGKEPRQCGVVVRGVN